MSLWCGLGHGLRFGSWSALEEVVTQGSFKIGYKLAHGLKLGHAEGCRGGVSDGLKFRFGVFRLGLSTLDRRLGFVRDGSGKKVFTQRRL
jgi:hypothetical protein